MTSDTMKRNSPASVARKISKGVIERKRRARINRSLSELKFIILSESQDKVLHSKLDKAEILERTLAYVQALQTRASTPSSEFHDKYREGFFSCMHEVDRFLTVEKVDELSRQKVTNYLAFCSTGLDHLSTQNFSTSPSPPLNYAVVPQSPAPSMASSGSSYSGLGSPAECKPDPVWRPW